MARARAYEFPEQVPFDYATANVSANEALGLSWFSNAKVYEWNEDYGDVSGPADPELEKELFSSQYHSEEGNQMSGNLDVLHRRGRRRSRNPASSSRKSAGTGPPSPLTLRAVRGGGLTPRDSRQHQQVRLQEPHSGSVLLDPGSSAWLRCIRRRAKPAPEMTAAYLFANCVQADGKVQGKLAAPRPGLGDFRPTEMVTAEPLALVIVPTG